MHDMSVRRRRIAAMGLGLALVCLAACGGQTSTGAETAPTESASHPNRDAVTLRMLQLAQSGHVAAAREAVQAYLAAMPNDLAMIYNLACLDASLAEPDTALADLETALARGYTNFRLIRSDPGLSDLRDDPRLEPLVERYESALRDSFEARAITLEESYPLGPIPLHGRGAEADLQLAFDTDALALALTVRDAGPDGDGPPWSGGRGVQVNLVRPLSRDEYESPRFHAVALGVEDGTPRAWLVSIDGHVRKTPLPDVTPTISRRDDALVYEIALPWEIFRPYAPPLDQDMGLNVIYTGAGPVGLRPVLALMTESRFAWEGAPWRRYVPIAFWSSDRSRPVLRARLYDRLAEYGEVGLEFALWSLSEGPGEYRLSLVDDRDRRLADPAPKVFAFDTLEGLNFFNESYALGGLPDGTYRLELSLDGPDGRAMTYAETFARFDVTTVDALNERLYRLGTAESQIVRHELFRLARDLDRRHPQDDPSNLLVRCADIAERIGVLEAGDSVLPDAGPVHGGFAVDNMTQRDCALYFPSGHRDLAAPHLLLVVPPRPTVEMQLAEALGAALADRPDVIVAVPQSHGSSALALAPASEQTEMALRWVRELVGAVDVTLVGLGGGADAALAISLDRPDLVDRVWLETDRLLVEGDYATPAGWDALLTGRANAVPYLLVTRPDPSERPARLAEAMRKRGFDVEAAGAGMSEAVVWIAERVETR